MGAVSRSSSAKSIVDSGRLVQLVCNPCLPQFDPLIQLRENQSTATPKYCYFVYIGYPAWRLSYPEASESQQLLLNIKRRIPCANLSH